MLSFVKIREEHLEKIRKWRTSEEVTKYMYTDPEITPEEQKRWYERIKADKTRMDWVINFDGEDLGVVSLYDIDWKNQRAFWAYYIGSPNARGKGIGRGVELSVLDYVFNRMGLHKLCCEVLSFNEFVVSIHKKYGSKIEGTFREHIFKNGKFYDVVRMGILKQEWEAEVKDRFEYHRAKIEEYTEKLNR